MRRTAALYRTALRHDMSRLWKRMNRTEGPEDAARDPERPVAGRVGAADRSVAPLSARPATRQVP
ncbi:hypothetical protein GMJLKIPL_2508 [Methylobacterium isbiliense]|jgi:hypothetical protein|uniref:Uncharacterized protein n=1 Tax=Methylobacterium isbiliense TaxID=315478 RepID=A0ABQ4SBQ9_9HYPH|nr:hypothetical protein GMJLKIPL_2508 [Methylobacterium isbiliense]